MLCVQPCRLSSRVLHCLHWLPSNRSSHNSDTNISGVYILKVCQTHGQTKQTTTTLGNVGVQLGVGGQGAADVARLSSAHHLQTHPGPILRVLRSQSMLCGGFQWTRKGATRVPLRNARQILKQGRSPPRHLPKHPATPGIRWHSRLNLSQYDLPNPHLVRMRQGQGHQTAKTTNSLDPPGCSLQANKADGLPVSSWAQPQKHHRQAWGPL